MAIETARCGAWAAGLALALAILSVTGAARAAELAAPSGPVVLTLAGAVAKTNRGPFAAFDDAFIAFREQRFERAAAFDRAMLERLGSATVELKAPSWPRAFRFEGPRLRDLLAAVGAEGRSLTALALDGYAVEITSAELAEEDWIVALSADGRPLAIGGHGPAWLVFPPRHDGPPTADDDARWPWAVFFLAVR